MQTTTPNLTDDPERPTYINVKALLAGRLLIQANSGGGKSRTIRRLLEQTHGTCQHIVLDVEGEFHTLRERFPYVLASKDGDCPADVKTAPLLARTLLELGVSAIIDIYELGQYREDFVAAFLNALIHSPRDLWHPALIVVDEAAKLCPEGSKSDCATAVIDLMTLGRKRGFAGVLATQRIAPLSKTAAAECNNKLVGRTTLDIDCERAAKELGMAGNAMRDRLRRLTPGQFFVVGSAFVVPGSGGVELVQIGSVQTTHPTAGEPSPKPTPTPATIRKVLGRLREIPAEAAAEAKTIDELKQENLKLRAELRGAKAGTTNGVAIEKYQNLDKAARELEDKVHRLDGERTRLRGAIGDYLDALAGPLARLREHSTVTSGPPKQRSEVSGHDGRHPKHAPEHRDPRSRVDAPTPNATPSNGLPRMERAILTALAQHRPDTLAKKRILTLTGYAASGSTVKAFARLTAQRWISGSGDRLWITAAGLSELGDFERLPTGDALRKYLLASGKLSTMEKKLLQIVSDQRVQMSRKDVLAGAGYQSSGSSVKAFARLISMGYLLTDGRGMVRAAEELFG